MLNECLETSLNIKLNSEAADMINQHAKTVHFPAGHTILHEGDTSSSLYFVIKGVVRGYYIDDKGNDITKYFAAETEFCSTEGFRTSEPSSFTIECLEDCSCVQMPYSLVEYLVRCDSSMSDFIRRLFQNEVSKQESRNKSFMLQTTDDRYTAFCNEYPHLHERLALKYIASFIGVRASSLSRIRKQINLTSN